MNVFCRKLISRTVTDQKIHTFFLFCKISRVSAKRICIHHIITTPSIIEAITILGSLIRTCHPPDLVHVVHQHVDSLKHVQLLLPEAEQPGGGEAGQHSTVLRQVLRVELPATPRDSIDQ